MQAFWTSLLILLASASTLAWFAALLHENGVCPLRDLGRFFGSPPAAGSVLSVVTVERSRVVEFDNAVVRETYREESSWNGVRRSWAGWWDDSAHSGRHGRPRLVRGDARAWVYTDFDGNGHETRHVVTNGVATIVGRTWTRYVRLVRDGRAAVKKETWRAATQNAEFGDASNACSHEIAFSDTGDGTPLLMRGAVAESLDEDGVLTVNAHSLSDGVLSCYDTAGRTAPRPATAARPGTRRDGSSIPQAA